MAYDEDLAGRTREPLAELTDFDERKMFGGLAFTVNTHMSCGIVQTTIPRPQEIAVVLRPASGPAVFSVACMRPALPRRG